MLTTKLIALFTTMDNELVQTLHLSSSYEQLTTLSSVLAKHKDDDKFTPASAQRIIELLKERGLMTVEAIEKCMYLCELTTRIDMAEGLYLMIQLYVNSMNEYVHHIWDAIELYLFENPRQSSVDYLTHLLRIEQDPIRRSLYQDWITGLTQELQQSIL